MHFKVSVRIVKICLCNKICYPSCQLRREIKRIIFYFFLSHTPLKLVSMFKCLKSCTLQLRYSRSPVILQMQAYAIYVTILSFASMTGQTSNICNGRKRRARKDVPCGVTGHSRTTENESC